MLERREHREADAPVGNDECGDIAGGQAAGVLQQIWVCLDARAALEALEDRLEEGERDGLGRHSGVDDSRID